LASAEFGGVFDKIYHWAKIRMEIPFLKVALPGKLSYRRRPAMSNRAIWNVRRRHEWLTKPLKGKRLKKRSRTRVGLQAAIERHQGVAPAPTES
jgi:hypothetical protein